ncbi:lipase family protein [Nocardia alba]|uniref:Secretory lipase n=1 Tax=Nocardia alba TaxID=225051 RepID=A0A4R1FNA6_9NOCA|nr:lipase family protein [Nocardia alba]TCJ95670.1 secretory lipase [Nocardia alba]
MKSGKRAWIAALTGTLVVVGVGVVATSTVGAQPPPMQAAGGDIVYAGGAATAITIPGPAGPIPARSTRIVYTSNDTHGAPNTVVGTYLESTQPWTGPGPRPLVAYAGGAQGQSAECSPSAMLGQVVRYQPPADVVFEYDIMAIYQLLASGMAVVMTDYHDFGVPGVHDFLNRRTQGYAVLDSARAALRLPGSGLGPDAPVIIYGYSQGGMASAAAAELQAEYAPELSVRGVHVGGPVSGPQDFIARSDGNPGVAPAIAWVLNGIAADYPETRPVLDAELNDTGKAILHSSVGTCGGGLSETFVQPQETSRWTTSGLPLTAVIDRSPELKAAFDEQRLGGTAPVAPVRVYSARNDEKATYFAARDLAARWCGGGAAVQLDADNSVPAMAGFLGTHDLAFFPSLTSSQPWMVDRLAGVPAPVNCAALP